jgi:hypothetical protein
VTAGSWLDCDPVAFSTILEKRPWLDAERFCNAGDIVYRNIAFGPLHRTEVCSVDAALVAEGLLTKPALRAARYPRRRFCATNYDKRHKLFPRRAPVRFMIPSEIGRARPHINRARCGRIAENGQRFRASVIYPMGAFFDRCSILRGASRRRLVAGRRIAIIAGLGCGERLKRPSALARLNDGMTGDPSMAAPAAVSGASLTVTVETLWSIPISNQLTSEEGSVLEGRRSSAGR